MLRAFLRKRDLVVLALAGSSQLAPGIRHEAKARTLSYGLDVRNESPVSPKTPVLKKRSSVQLKQGRPPCQAESHDRTRFGADLLLFGHLQVGASNVLLTSPSKLTVAITELKPISQGHTIIIPRRQVERLADLTSEELNDFWQTARDTQNILQRRYHATAFNIAVLDGIGAGQPMPHLHAHVVPRIPGDALGGDRVHEAIAEWSLEPRLSERPKFDAPSDDDRKPRDDTAMASEASQYRLSNEISDVRYKFAKHVVSGSHVFYRSPAGLTLAFVNLKPLVPGHVLVVPLRVVPRLADLTDEELKDLFLSVREVQAIVCRVHGADAANIGIQDGKDAGQTVPHVHVHILPRHSPTNAL